MLTLLQISKLQDFYGYNFENEYAPSPEVLVVTPNPTIADQIRNSFKNAQQKTESVTISKFIKDELVSLLDESLLENFRGKSELNLLLGAIWKKVGEMNDYIGFKKAFNLLTELRSYSMNPQVFETVLEHYDPELARIVQVMHQILEDMEIIDEHKSYFLLSERFRAGDLPPEKKTERSIVFHGFDFMTASQVDLLKSLALRDNIFIPVYKSVYENSLGTDWIKWFDEYNLKIEDISSESTDSPTLRYSNFAKGYFSKSLLSQKGTQYCVLGTKNLETEFIQEVSLGNASFKLPVDIFIEENTLLFEEIQNFVSHECGVEDLKGFLQKEMETAIGRCEYRRLKCIMIYLTSINTWESLSDENNVLGPFDVEILRESSLLDSPRINLTTFSDKHDLKVYSLAMIDEIKDEKVVLGIHSKHRPYKGIDANYSEGVERYLASIGPIRRAGYEMDSFKERFKEFIQDNEVTLLIENGVLDHDINWSEVFEQFLLEPTEVDVEQLVGKNSILFDKQKFSLDSLSASRLQRYFECPQKFYFQYVDKILPKIEFEDELLPMELGNIEHKVIELYFQNNSEYSEDKHDELIQRLIEESLRGKNISKELFQEYFIEVKSFTQVTINKLFALKNSHGFEISFELPFDYLDSSLQYRGSIDCFLKNSEMTILLDFKRSSSVFQSFVSILEFEQLQLWFYLKRLEALDKVDLESPLSFGYVNLSEFESSMIFTNDKDLVDFFKKDLEIGKVKFMDNLLDKVSEYKGIEQDLIQKMSQDTKFAPLPRRPQVCDYCEIRNICSRGTHVDA